MTVSPKSIRSRQVDASGFTFNCLEAGDERGEPVILLHGVPETSAMWAPLMESLAMQGYHCIAFDQRGYSPQARPTEIDAYRHEHLGRDVLNVADAVGFDRFNLVGHDWGAAVGWCAVDIDSGDRIASYTSLSIPHYRGFAEATRDDPAAAEYRSLLDVIQQPGHLVESSMRADSFKLLRNSWSESHDTGLVDQYMSVFSEAGALEATFDWYRATRGHMSVLDGSSLAFGAVSIPTMLIWGNHDPAVTPMAIAIGRQYLTGPHEFVELDAGHWLMQEEPDIVSALILRQLQRHGINSVPRDDVGRSAAETMVALHTPA